MKNSTKFVLGGLVLGATAAVTGAAYHVNNNIIPGHVAAQLNASFDNAHQKNKVGGDAIEVSTGGAIAVEATGVLTYKVTMPAVLVKAKDGTLESTMAVSRSDYNLTFTDKKAAINAAMRGEGEVSVSMTADKPVHFQTTFSGEDATISGTCKDVTIYGGVDGKKYQFDTEAEKCVIDGKAEDSEMKMTLASDATFSGSLKNDGNDVFSGRSAVRFENLAIRAQGIDNAADKASIDAKEVLMVVTYSDLPALSSLPKALEKLTLSSMPDGVSAYFEIKKLQATGNTMFQLPEISAAAGFGVEGLKQERGAVKARFSYEIGPIRDPMLMMLAQGSPDKAACDVSVTDIPMKDITTIAEKTVDEAGKATGTPMGPEELLGKDGPVAAFEKAGTAVKLHCETAKTGLFSTKTDAEHKMQDGGFPGKGTMEIEGVEHVLRNLSMVLGTDLSGLTEAFKALAVPTANGKGLKWDYVVDKNGDVTINGHNAGIGVPMLPVLPR